MNNPAFEEEFMALVKGLPDLERIVSRIHAKNCKIKDFLHALNVGLKTIWRVVQLMSSAAQSFKKLSKGLKALEESAGGFKSKNIPGLLRSAPDLMPNIKHVREMFVQAEKEKGSGTNLLRIPTSEDVDATTPQTLINSSQLLGRTKCMTTYKRRSQRVSRVWKRN